MILRVLLWKNDSIVKDSSADFQNSGFCGTLFCVKMVQRYARKKLDKWTKLNFGEIKAAKKMTQQIYSEFKWNWIDELYSTMGQNLSYFMFNILENSAEQ